MAYQIYYTGRTEGNKTGISRARRRAVLTIVCFLIFLLGVRRNWPEGWMLLQKLVLPESMENAAEVFCQELQYGAGLSYAVHTFCRMVVSG